MSDFREAMWGVVQSVVSELDFDFDAYAAEHFERMERTASEPGFLAALRLNGEEGARRRPRRDREFALGPRSGARTRRAASSRRSSSSSVPMRTGPLNQFFADRNHQPPNTRPMPANQRIV